MVRFLEPQVWFQQDPQQNLKTPEKERVKDMEIEVYKKESFKLAEHVRGTSLKVKELSDSGRQAYIDGVLENHKQIWQEKTDTHLGYPLNLDFNYSALGDLNRFSLNNLGDPFIEGGYGVHSRDFEVDVLDWFANLWEIDVNDYWGYTTNGGSEGNLHGLLLGRQLFPDEILYTSKETHYSVFKAAVILGIKEVIQVKTLTSGEIDCTDLKCHLNKNRKKTCHFKYQHSTIYMPMCCKSTKASYEVYYSTFLERKKNQITYALFICLGTTMKGAIDDLGLTIKTLEGCGFDRNQYYIHCDGALSSIMLPFMQEVHKVTFKKSIDSISVSGHKFIGCPMPCGVQIARIEHIKELTKDHEYIGSRDATITGSRNGHTPIFLWYALNQKGYKGLEKDVNECLENAKYLKDQLKKIGVSSMLNKASIIVVFERPRDKTFIRRWQLACGENIAHVCVMPNVTREKLDTFVKELSAEHSKWYPNERKQQPCVASDIGKEDCACRACA